MVLLSIYPDLPVTCHARLPQAPQNIIPHVSFLVGLFPLLIVSVVVLK